MTPLRSQLKRGSALQSLIRDGIGAVRKSDRVHIEAGIRPRFSDSLDIDAGFKKQLPSDHRWDYLLGDRITKLVVALEPHSAKQDQVTRVIEKKKRAVEQLRAHWREGSPVHGWFWVASGEVQFPDIDRTSKRLAQENITFIGKELKAKHLPKP